ncbi:MAG: DUF1501 domain-containing protein, partial [Planctomycetaceae bacterium]
MPANPLNHAGFSRRSLLQVGCSGVLGLSLPALLQHQARAAGESMPQRDRRRAKSVILIFLTGAPSHLDMFDLKPEAPAEVRGEFNPISTAVAGMQICEHLPRLALRADRYAVIRSMTHDLPGHEQATHFVLTGIDRLPLGATHMASRQDWPCYASGLEHVRPGRDGIPSGVMLPTYLHNGYGFSGQNSGFLGAKYDPWHITQDPNAEKFRVDLLEPPAGSAAGAMAQRRDLLATISKPLDSRTAARSEREFSDYQNQALSMLSAGRMSEAFALNKESKE